MDLDELSKFVVWLCHRPIAFFLMFWGKNMVLNSNYGRRHTKTRRRKLVLKRRKFLGTTRNACFFSKRHVGAKPHVRPHPKNTPKQYRILVIRGGMKTLAVRRDLDFWLLVLGLQSKQKTPCQAICAIQHFKKYCNYEQRQFFCAPGWYRLYHEIKSISNYQREWLQDCRVVVCWVCDMCIGLSASPLTPYPENYWATPWDLLGYALVYWATPWNLLGYALKFTGLRPEIYRATPWFTGLSPGIYWATPWDLVGYALGFTGLGNLASTIFFSAQNQLNNKAKLWENESKDIK